MESLVTTEWLANELGASDLRLTNVRLRCARRNAGGG